MLLENSIFSIVQDEFFIFDVWKYKLDKNIGIKIM